MTLAASVDETFLTMVEPLRGELTAHCYRMLGSVHDAEDLVQETYLRAWRSYDGFEGRSSLRTWVYRILVNTAKRRAIQEQRAVPWASLSLADEPTVDPDAFQGADEPYPGHWRSFPEPWPEQATLSKEVLEVIRAAVDRLPAQQRAVITLRDIEGCSAAETCELLDLSEGNQRVLLHRARAGVRREVADYLGKDGPR
jgi:RNA polymerase sigma-70 factor, ECF subfamily